MTCGPFCDRCGGAWRYYTKVETVPDYLREQEIPEREWVTNPLADK